MIIIVQNNNINQIKVHFIRTGSVLVDETLTGQGDSRILLHLQAYFDLLIIV